MQTVETKKGEAMPLPNTIKRQNDMAIDRLSSTARSLSASMLCG